MQLTGIKNNEIFLIDIADVLYIDRRIKVTSFLTCSAFFIIIFKWFPVNMWKTWLMFFICFVIYFVASAVLATVKNNLENKKLADGLAKLREFDDIDENQD